MPKFTTRRSKPSKYALQARIEYDERDKLREYAKAAGLSVSEFVRRRALGKPVASKVDMQMVRELCRLGGLMKHAHNESGGAYSDLTASILIEIKAAIKRIESGMDNNDLQEN